MSALFGGEVVEGDDVQPVGLVGVAEQDPAAVGDQEPVVGGAHRGQVGELVGAAPAGGSEVVDLEAVTAGAARYPAVPVA